MVKILNLDAIRAADRSDLADLERELDETRDLCRRWWSRELFEGTSITG